MLHSETTQLRINHVRSGCCPRVLTLSPARCAHDQDLLTGQALRLRLELDLSWLTGFRANYNQAQSVVSISFLRLKRFQVSSIAIVHGHDLSRSRERKTNPVLRTRNEQSVPVSDGDRYERKVAGVGLYRRAIGLQDD